VQLRIQALGAEHPSTLASAESLVEWEIDNGGLGLEVQ